MRLGALVGFCKIYSLSQSIETGTRQAGPSSIGVYSSTTYSISAIMAVRNLSAAPNHPFLTLRGRSRSSFVSLETASTAQLADVRSATKPKLPSSIAMLASPALFAGSHEPSARCSGENSRCPKTAHGVISSWSKSLRAGAPYRQRLARLCRISLSSSGFLHLLKRVCVNMLRYTIFAVCMDAKPWLGFIARCS